MRSFAKQVHKLAALLFLAFLGLCFSAINSPARAQSPTQTPAFPNKPLALRDPCALDPRNLVVNGSMGMAYNTKYGTAANAWTPFKLSANAPNFRWVDNEQIDPNGSQQIYANETFDAGIYQTVHNLKPGASYWFRLGYSLAAKSYDGPNVRVETIGRKVGVDPLGGSDPKSANVIWGPDLFDGNAALNRPEMIMVFTARAPNATIFLRAIARDQSAGENRVWFDAVCMEERTDIAVATALVTATKPAPTITPTAAAPTATPTSPPTLTPTIAPTATTTPTPTLLPLPTLVPPATATRPAPASSASGAPPSILQIVIVASVLLALIAIALFVVGYWWWRNNQLKQGNQVSALIEPRSFLVGLTIGFALALLLSVSLFLFK